MNFGELLADATKRVGNPCCLGIDPHLDLLPDDYAVARDPSQPRAERAAALREWACELIDVAAESIAVVKPQSAFFERLGADGVAAWESVVGRAREAGLIVLGDVKRGDIGSTAAAYAQATLVDGGGKDDAPRMHAATLNPYLGTDSMQPFLDACKSGAGIFVLVRTSNPGSADFQTLGEPPLWERVAAKVREWGESCVEGDEGLLPVGAVVGATHPELLARARELMPRTPLLLPGYGAQGAGAADVLDAFLPGEPGQGALVTASRSVSFAQRSERYAAHGHWKDAARAALEDMAAELSAALAC